MLQTPTLAPPLHVSEWFNTDTPITLNHFGHMDDLQLGALLGTVLSKATPSAT